MSGTKTGTVYAVEAGDLIKIGYTAGPVENRIGDLRRMNGTALHLVCTWPGTQETERSLHALFAEHRKHGEWFDLPDGWRETADRHLGVGSTGALVEMAADLAEQLELCGMRDVDASMVLDCLACAGLTLRRGGGESSDAYFIGLGFRINQSGSA